jgi:hypothetical protein
MRLMRRLAIVAAVMVLALPVFAEENTYVGADKCKGCHPMEYKDFQSRKFGKAWAVLDMLGKTKDPECLKCHVTGYNKPNGFISGEATPYLRYKECEACHGPAGNHVANPADSGIAQGLKVNANQANTCIECHHHMKTHYKQGE